MKGIVTFFLPLHDGDVEPALREELALTALASRASWETQP